ncbi:MAG: hypothetical protein HON44_00430 [Glaciecola sp.]|nr:hypothetical protein [Glaciecola sp.]
MSYHHSSRSCVPLRLRRDQKESCPAELAEEATHCVHPRKGFVLHSQTESSR